MFKWLLKIVCVLALLGGLAACRHDKDTKDLSNYVTQVRNQQVIPLAPLSPLQAYVAHTYPTDLERSPFQVAGNHTQAVVNDLLDYQLNSMQMVGKITYNGQPWALIALPNGMVERVTIGQALGASNGQVIAITDSSLTVLESTTIAGKTLTRQIELPLNPYTVGNQQ